MPKPRRRPNVQRMQRAMTRNRDASEGRRYEQWLADMTPEHRAMHGKSFICGECMKRTMIQVALTLSGEARA